MRLQILGSFDAESVPLAALGGPRQRAVLVVLALLAPSPVPLARLAEALWLDPPPAAASTLQGYVSHLRHALEPVGAGIIHDRAGYRLAAPGLLLDAEEFEQAVREGERRAREAGAERDAIAALAAGLALWRGPALGEFLQLPFAGPAAVRLTELRRRARVGLVRLLLRLGRGAEVPAECESWLGEDPLDEELWGLLMLAHVRAGRQGDALGVFRRARARLTDELGVEPGPALQRIHQAVLRQDPWLATPAAAGDAVPSVPVTSGTSAAGAGTFGVDISDAGAPGGAEPPGGPGGAGPPGGRGGSGASSSPGSTASPLPRSAALPQPVSVFVGRQRELAEICDLLRTNRLVTCTGTGGVGKTRLALAVAERSRTGAGTAGARLCGPFAGLGFVDLSDARQPDGVAIVLARAFAVRSGPLADVVERVAHVLAGEPVLLVVDNCEQVVEEAARFSELLLEACAGLRILATSREALQISGEVVWRVPGMLAQYGDDAGDALELFRQRARQRGVRLGRGEVAAAVELCRRVDGLPLAIELAASRVGAGVSVLALAEDLERWLLDESRRGSHSRQRSMRAVIGWSFELCQPAEQALLRRLAIIIGAFDLPAAAAVGQGPGVDAPGVPALLRTLTRRSLLVEDAGWLRLPEAVRLYAREQLRANGEDDAARRRWALHLLTRAQRCVRALRGPEGPAAGGELDRLRADLTAVLDYLVTREDATAALQLATALAPYWELRYDLVDGLKACQSALALGGEPGLRGPLCYAAARLAVNADDFAVAYDLVSEAVELARAGGDRREQGLALTLLVEVERVRNAGSRRCEDLLAQAIRVAGELPDPVVAAEVARIGTFLAWDRGDLELARARAEQFTALADQLGDLLHAAEADENLAGVLRDLGELDRAEELYERAALRFRVVGHRLSSAHVVYCQARLALMRGEPDRCDALARDALAAFSALGDSWGRAVCLRARGQAALLRGDARAARRFAEQALDLLRTHGYVDDLAATLLLHGQACLADGATEAAEASASEGFALANTDPPNRWAGPLQTLLGRVAFRDGRVELARERCALGLRLCQRSAPEREVALARAACAEVAGGATGAPPRPPRPRRPPPPPAPGDAEAGGAAYPR